MAARPLPLPNWLPTTAPSMPGTVSMRDSRVGTSCSRAFPANARVDVTACAPIAQTDTKPRTPWIRRSSSSILATMRA
jgi:hypothetical protein